MSEIWIVHPDNATVARGVSYLYPEKGDIEIQTSERVEYGQMIVIPKCEHDIAAASCSECSPVAP